MNPYYFSNGLISGSGSGDHFPIKDNQVYTLFDTGSFYWGGDNTTLTNANQFYTGGVLDTSLFPTLSISILGDYRFYWDFRIASYLSYSGSGVRPSGSYCLGIFQNDVSLYQITQSHELSQSIFNTDPYGTQFAEIDFTGSTATVTCIPGDKINLRFSLLRFNTASFTASVGGRSDSNNGLWYSYPITGSFSWISSGSIGSATPYISASVTNSVGLFDTLVLSTGLSSMVNKAIFHPEYESGSASAFHPSSSLYTEYGNVDYKFTINNNDLITFTIYNSVGELKLYEYNVLNTYTGSNNRFHIQLDGLLPSFPITSSLSLNTILFATNSFESVVFIRRIEDETVTYLSFNRNEIQTSYGLLIPDKLHKKVLNNIDNITSQVKTKLIQPPTNNNITP